MNSIRYDFKDKVAVVTGAAGGIGSAIATGFGRNGASVIVADIDLKGAEETVRCVREAGGEAASLKVDVTSEDDVKSMVAFAVERYGKLDFASNNAGIEGAQLPIAELPRDRWDQVVAINLTGVYQCMQYELQQMLKQGSGAIVNMASLGGLMGTATMAGYVATKHGVIGLTKTAALEVAKKGIRVNAVAPGAIDAGLGKKTSREFREMVLKLIPVGRMGEAEEIVSAVLWLCSPEASFVLGHTMIVDGAMMSGVG